MAKSPVYHKPAPAAPASSGRDAKAVHLLARFGRAQALRAPYESQFQEAMDYTMPAKESVFAVGPASRRSAKIYDETGVVALQEGTSRIQMGLIPPFARWAGLKAGVATPPDQREEINKSLEDVTEMIFEVLNESNFNQEAPEALLDAMLSVGCLEIEEGDAVNPIVCRAIPIPRLWVDVGPDDQIDSYFFRSVYKLAHLLVRFPKGTVPPELAQSYAACCAGTEDATVTVVENVRRDYSEPNVERYVRLVVAENEQRVILEETFEGAGSCPYIGFRWAKSSGEAWGRGPLLNAMPAIRTCNLTIELILENAEMAIAGIWTAEDDGVINVDTVQLIPGTVIPVAPGGQGMKALAPAGNFDVAQLVLADMRANIKRALYNDTLGNVGKTPMSATEVAERTADLARSIGSAYGRLQVEFVQRVVKRVVYILKKKRMIQLPLPVNGQAIKVVADSPLARAQEQADVNQFLRWGEAVTVQFGPQQKNLIVDGSTASTWLADKMGVPRAVIRPPAEQAALLQQLAQQAAAPEEALGEPTGQQAGPAGM